MAHLLIVDDDAASRDTLARVLKQWGHTSEMAINVAEAVHQAQHKHFDLVFMDITIPQQDGAEKDIYGGLEATKRILAIPHLRELPVVAVTAHGMDGHKKAVLNAGCREVLMKGSENFLQRTKEVIARYAPGKTMTAPSKSRVAVQPTAVPSVTAAATSTVALAVEVRTEAEAGCSSTPTTVTLAMENSASATAVAAPVVTAVAEPGLPAARNALGQIQSHVAQASAVAQSLLETTQDQDRDNDFIHPLQNLCSALGAALQRLQGEGTPPAAGESLSHWVTSIVFGSNMECESLLSTETDHHFGQHREPLQIIDQHLKQVLQLRFELDSDMPAAATSIATSVPVDVVQQQLADASVAADPRRERLLGDLLVVDDDWNVLRDMENKLRQLGHRVFACSNGETALSLLQHQHFDACLLDVHMPGLGGMELLARIRAEKHLANLPIIIVSGSGQLDAAASAIEAGADDYLTKPADVSLLRARIEACLKQVRSRREDLEKFLPAKVIDSVLMHPEQMRQGRLTDVTVMFCGIRQFSRISGQIGPSETIKWISDVMDKLSTCILNHGGTLVDYIGDEIMAMWGAPQEDADHARQACQCALALQSEIQALDEYWMPRLGSPMRVGVGVNTGPAVVGNTGSKFRFKYGALGATVNVASRVQGATKYLRSSVLMTESTARHLSNAERGRRLCRVRAQNIEAPIWLYELAGKQGPIAKDRDTKYEQALCEFESENFDEAIRMLAELLAEFPKDGPTQLLMSRAIESQFTPTFDPVWTLPGK